jgi:hypothetical protein
LPRSLTSTPAAGTRFLAAVDAALAGRKPDLERAVAVHSSLCTDAGYIDCPTLENRTA